MVPRLTRRRLLGGLAVAGAGGGVAVAPRSWYPNPVVDRLIGYRRLPDTDTQPPVPDGAVPEALERLGDRLEQAETLWERIDDDRESLPEEARFGPTLLSEALGRYPELQDATPDRETLSALRRQNGNAGYAIGAGRVALEETDAEALVERGEEIRSEIDEIGASIAYRGDDPTSDVATLYWIERPLLFARLNSHRNGVYMGGVAPPDEYDRYHIPRTWEAHLQAEISLLESRHLRSAYERDVDGTRSFESGLESVHDAFGDEISETHQTYEDREALVDSLEEGPYRHARYQCWQFTHGDLEADDGGSTAGLDLFQTVRRARNVLKLRSYPDAVDGFAFEEGEGLDPALVYREEKRAAERARTVVDEYDTPLFRLLVDDAVRLLDVADLGLTRDDDRTRSRATAYAYYRVGHAQLRHAGAVYERLLDALE